MSVVVFDCLDSFEEDKAAQEERDIEAAYLAAYYRNEFNKEVHHETYL